MYIVISSIIILHDTNILQNYFHQSYIPQTQFLDGSVWPKPVKKTLPGITGLEHDAVTRDVPVTNIR